VGAAGKDDVKEGACYRELSFYKIHEAGYYLSISSLVQSICWFQEAKLRPEKT